MNGSSSGAAAGDASARWRGPGVGEWFDVVDENDEVVGRELRENVHARALRHRAVHLFVTRSDGAVFLQKRSPSKDTAPGCWDSSVSGHVDSGEAYEAAVLREAREEIGLRLPGIPEELGRVAACRETGEEFVRIYRTRQAGPFTLDPEEIETAAWFHPEQVDDWMLREPAVFSRAFRHIWREVRQRLG